MAMKKISKIKELNMMRLLADYKPSDNKEHIKLVVKYGLAAWCDDKWASSEEFQRNMIHVIGLLGYHSIVSVSFSDLAKNVYYDNLTILTEY
jgi:CO dehydrogenase/acetyl-CoA synthase epsilon subunit